MRERIQINPNFGDVLIPSVPVNQYQSTARGNTATLQQMRRRNKQFEAFDNLNQSLMMEGQRQRKADAEEVTEQAIAQEKQYQAQRKLHDKQLETRLDGVVGKYALEMASMKPQERLSFLRQQEDYQDIINSSSQRPNERAEFEYNVLNKYGSKWEAEHGEQVLKTRQSEYNNQGIPAVESAFQMGGLEEGVTTINEFLSGASDFGMNRGDSAKVLMENLKALNQSADTQTYPELLMWFNAMDKADLGEARAEFDAYKPKIEATLRKNMQEEQVRNARMYVLDGEAAVESGDVTRVEMHIKNAPKGFYSIEQERSLLKRVGEQGDKLARQSNLTQSYLYGKVSQDVPDFKAEDVKALDEDLATKQFVQQPDGTFAVDPKFKTQYFMQGVGVNRDVKTPRTDAMFFGGLDFEPLDSNGQPNPRYIQGAQHVAELAASVGETTAKDRMDTHRYNEYRLYRTFTNDRIGDPNLTKEYALFKQRLDARKAAGISTPSKKEMDEVFKAFKDNTDLSKSEVQAFFDGNPQLVKDIMMGSTSADQAARLLAQTSGQDFLELDDHNVFNGGYVAEYAQKHYSADPAVAIDDVLEKYAESLGVDSEDLDIEVHPHDKGIWLISTPDSIAPREVDMIKYLDEHKSSEWQTEQQQIDAELAKAQAKKAAERERFEANPWVKLARIQMEN
ncbi:hypothetical protein [Vibrio alginolyticus]|uniref:hypothetical protein n=1 Tax=Vibrio alginolyticus TaxID=663 RepID=UPI00211A3142|nr:hypothetical protein [Vibrio alginolyticus]MCQ9067294.1 hypothetical protein [Vibrio alginolyticus]